MSRTSREAERRETAGAIVDKARVQARGKGPRRAVGGPSAGGPAVLATTNAANGKQRTKWYLSLWVGMRVRRAPDATEADRGDTKAVDPFYERRSAEGGDHGREQEVPSPNAACAHTASQPWSSLVRRRDPRSVLSRSRQRSMSPRAPASRQGDQDRPRLGLVRGDILGWFESHAEPRGAPRESGANRHRSRELALRPALPRCRSGCDIERHHQRQRSFRRRDEIRMKLFEQAQLDFPRLSVR